MDVNFLTLDPAGSPQTINDPGFAQIVRGHLKLHAIAEVEPDKTLPHLARNMGKDHLAIGKLYAKHRSGENRDDFTFNWDGRFIGHGALCKRVSGR
jgi:hypothetical protein